MIGAWTLLKFGGPAVIIAVLGAYGYGYVSGKHKAESACQTASLRAEIAKLKHEKAVAEAAKAEAESGAAELAKEKAESEKQNEEYRDELAKRPDDRCIVNDADLRRMQ